MTYFDIHALVDYAFEIDLLDQICASERSELTPQKMIFTCMIKDTCYDVNKEKGNYNNHHFCPSYCNRN